MSGASSGLRLAAGLTLLFGIDPIVSLRDNGTLEAEQIPDALAWVAYHLVDAALAQGAETAGG